MPTNDIKEIQIQNLATSHSFNTLPNELKFMPGYYNPSTKKYVLPTKLETENDHQDAVDIRLNLCLKEV